VAAEQWWALSEVTGQWAYFQATAAQAQARAKMAITYGGEQALYGPYASEAAAKAAVASGAAQPQQTGSPNVIGTGGNKTSLPNPLTGLAAIGDFFGRLTQGNTWIRIGEGLLGLVLIAVGIARITHAIPVATSIAKTVGAAGVVA
jgi:hypothetical protein